MSNLNRNDPDLARVTVPLALVMADAQLSWAEREVIALAIQQCVSAHQSLMDEQRQLANLACQGSERK